MWNEPEGQKWPKGRPSVDEVASTTALHIRHSDLVLSTVHSRSAAASSSLAASWCRSALYYGLDPAAKSRDHRFDQHALAHLREANDELIAAANPAFNSLAGSVVRSGALVALCNLEGIILETRTETADASAFDAFGLAAGTEWSEAAEGTNGIGTCLVEGRPVTILRTEHFATRNVCASCMDAPVFDPEGRLIGALDVSSLRADHDDAMALMISALVRNAAHQIERTLFCNRFSHARIVHVPDQSGQASALLAIDRDDLVIGATRMARKHYSLGFGRIENIPLSDLLGGSIATRGFEDSERSVLRQALARANGNVARAARMLGIGRATMYRHMERIGIVVGRPSRSKS